MKSVTIYFKDSDREITINGLINILIGTGDSRKPFVPVSDHYMFFDDDKNYLLMEFRKKFLFVVQPFYVLQSLKLDSFLPFSG